VVGLENKIKGRQTETISPNDLSTIIKEVMGERAKEVKTERDILEYKKSLIQQEIKPLNS
jgi:hypothetical protein